MKPTLQQRASKTLHNVANGIFDVDEIGNTIRDLLHALRMKVEQQKNRKTRKENNNEKITG